MQIYADYHTHTIYSHGKGTIRENVDAAVKKGLKKIAITDHGSGHLTYGVRSRELVQMRKEIDGLKKEYKNIEILLGVEANLVSLDGDIDVTEKDRELLDILLVGFHNGAAPRNLRSAGRLYLRNYASKLILPMKKSCAEINTEAMIKAVNRYKVDIVTHPGAKIPYNIQGLAEAAAKRGTALEINSSHGNMSVEYVKIAMKENVSFVIDSDAHTPGRVGDFTKGIKIAQEAGLDAARVINAIK
jgi:putative hydrolase